MENYISSHHREPAKKDLYDEMAKRLLSQLNQLETAKRVDIVIDRSKNKDEINFFDQAVMGEIRKRDPKKIPLTIRHRSSQGDAGLQAVDIFCSGIGRKYELSDLAWYKEFSDKIAVEMNTNFRAKKRRPLLCAVPEHHCSNHTEAAPPWHLEGFTRPCNDNTNCPHWETVSAVIITT